MVEASSAGVNTRYELPPGLDGLIPQHVAGMLSRLLDLYDEATAAGQTTESDVEGSNDATALAYMLGQLPVLLPGAQIRPDFVTLSRF